MSRDDRHHGEDAGEKIVDQNVRLLYDGLIEEGLPDRFQKLIDLIRSEDRQQDNEKDDEV